MMKHTIRWLVIAWLSLTIVANAGELQVTITGIRSTSGSVNIALYHGAENFLEPDAAVGGARLKTESSTVDTQFDNLVPGTYAIAVYHDENSNAKLDKNFLGIPKEGYAFSNNARGTVGPPSFKKAAFTIGEVPKMMSIEVKY